MRRLRCLTVAIATGAALATHAQEATLPAAVLELKAPEAVSQLWAGWQGKYVLFAQKADGIGEFKDLNGKRLQCGVIEVDFQTIFGDAAALKKTGELDVEIALQNNPDVYAQQFLERPNTVAFVTPEVARHYGFYDNPKLVELRIK